MIYENIVQTIGKTPVVRLSSLKQDGMAEIYAKLEFFNPGGSVKDRIAANMIMGMQNDKRLKKGDIIVEPTSGNTGIGIAMAASALGYEVILTMPETMSLERRKILAAYGAKLVLTEGARGMKGAIERAQQLASEQGYVMLSQFENIYNPEAHINSTAVEIMQDFKELDAFVAGVGTGGTLSGVGKTLKKNGYKTEIIAVEPEESAVISGNTPGAHKIQGIGAGFIPDTLDISVIDGIELVSAKEAFEASRMLAKSEGIMLGISGGAALSVAIRTAKRLGEGKKVLFVAPDNGERYLSTPLYEV
ncbi:cysteine synthase A [Campylobacter sp.]|uniref:cysteine synthase A n=1 Tax=Campylobacter sp. TaxID=205 RepID=UPI0026FCEAAE|nr:cysteine synthase A [Campylobacter sp.]